MGFLKSMQVAFGDRRQRQQGSPFVRDKSVTPVITRKEVVEPRPPKAGASDGELTPTQTRPPLISRNTDLELVPPSVYGRQAFSHSQPTLGRNTSSPAVSPGRPSQKYAGPLPPPLPPPTTPLPPVPPRAPQGPGGHHPGPYGLNPGVKGRSAGDLRLPPVSQGPLLSDELMGFEQLDALSGLPVSRVYGHRRGGGAQEHAFGSTPNLSGTPQGRYVPDYNSVPSGSSISSSSLTRGPSATSTSHSELHTGSVRLHADNVWRPLEACGVQQDFFLAGLNLTSAQQRLLLVSLPYEVVQTYRHLYANDLAYVAPHEHRALAQQQMQARGDLTLSPREQQNVLRAFAAVQATPAGNERLARFVRWALQAEVEEQRFALEYQIGRVPALSGQQMWDILRPLRLDAAQQARFLKHCTALQPSPVRLTLVNQTFAAQH